MLWLYRLLFLPVLLVSSPFYVRRMLRRGGYRENFLNRFGAFAPLPPKRPEVRRVWLQAVSVGEVLAVGPLIEALAREPGVEVFLTTTTSTGYALARKNHGSQVLGVGYFPLDFWAFSARAWRQIAPDLAVLTEGERWPEHIAQAVRRGVPSLAINARLSDRSFRRMQRVKFLVPTLIGGLTRVLAASEHDAERFRALGFSPEKITVTGNLKLDVAIPPLGGEERAQLRRELGLAAGVRVLLGSSTWPGEEEALLVALRMARQAGVACALLIVPRHAERRDEIEALLEKSGEPWHIRSRGAAAGEVTVAVADTTGELRRLAQLADLVFCGKSLPPHTEGQTPVEAAALGKAILFGPGMANFRVIARELVACGGARRVPDEAGLVASIVELLRDEPKRAAMAAAARGWQQANQGAAARTLAILRTELATRG
ncbi:MAG TPA: glycosyltransferase N-terminal domain-containing protein [Opitutaceae bacterium]|jgi:3-deoxy-D-manno-octulosonic-acid transferase|nr:glycosyltransferase N-terminal domain-containing protein [Opitutaceae bacterium]